ncbi:hypothetical protein VNO78_00240 [Psophocarpus tetragonolobus]|uniref:Uncharacterized protein n=1 Tax=Psophocarpus tetragonolobus TaxID=3891 RepID=A0AAN9SXU1_PSOTE
MPFVCVSIYIYLFGVFTIVDYVLLLTSPSNDAIARLRENETLKEKRQKKMQLGKDLSPSLWYKDIW